MEEERGKAGTTVFGFIQVSAKSSFALPPPRKGESKLLFGLEGYLLFTHAQKIKHNANSAGSPPRAHAACCLTCARKMP